MKKNLVTAAATAGLMLTAFGASASAQQITYTVRPGDSLWKISNLNSVSINHLKDWNHLSSDKIYVNQKLSLTYTIKSGDSLWAIAKANGTTVKELKSLNGLTSDLIRVGQQLKVPESNLNTASSVSAVTGNTNYTVKSGDSLSLIGARFNLSVSQLKSMNQLTTDTIKVGQTIIVPASQSNAGNTMAKSASQSAAASVTTSDSNKSEKAVTTANSPIVKKAAASSNSGVAQKQATTANSATTVKPAAAADSNGSEETVTASNSTTVKKSVATTSKSGTSEKPASPSNSTTTEKTAAVSNSSQTQIATASSASKVKEVIAEAEKYFGVPYRWGGNTPTGFDCSGFTKYVFNDVGISLPRTAADQYDATTPVSSPNVGDLVFFQTYKLGPSHVGIYLGNNKFISAAATGVNISDMTATYWKTRYLGARTPY